MSRAATGPKRIYLKRELERVDKKITSLKAVIGERLFMIHYTCVCYILICVQKILEGGNNCQKNIY